ncbi:hypothetical protein KKA53_02725 [Candidatus Dependentiae bacterium]|nr:hypothetical protein [Candidatus Dependentiae bacterium]
MITVLKTVTLFFSVVVVMPIVFFLLVGYFGNWFSLSIHKNSWLAKRK